METKPTKAIVAAVGTFVTVLTVAFADNVLGGDDLSNIVAGLVTMGVTIFGVWKVRNEPK